MRADDRQLDDVAARSEATLCTETAQGCVGGGAIPPASPLPLPRLVAPSRWMAPRSLRFERGFCCKDRGGPRRGPGSHSSSRDLEQPNDERGLSSDVAASNVLNLPLPDHRHRLVARQRSSCRPEPAEAKPRT